MRLVAMYGVALLASGTTQLTAQARVTRDCLDSIPASAMHATVAYLTNRYPDSLAPGRRANVPMIDNLTQAVAERIRTLLDTSRAKLPAAEPAYGWRDMGGRVAVTWRSDGSMSWRAVPDSVTTVWHDGATTLIIRALEGLRADGEQLLVPDSTRHDSATFTFGYAVADFDESGRIALLKLRMGVPVFTVRQPWSAPVRSRANQDGPRYPRRLREMGFQGAVVARFVVDEAGRYLSDSYEPRVPVDRPPPAGGDVVLWLEFARAVREALPRMAFEPARIAGCPIPQIVQQPFTFALSER